MSRVKDSFVLDEGDSRPNITATMEEDLGDSVIDEVSKRQRQMNKRSFMAVFTVLFCTMFIVAYYTICNLGSS